MSHSEPEPARTGVAVKAGRRTASVSGFTLGCWGAWQGPPPGEAEVRWDCAISPRRVGWAGTRLEAERSFGSLRTVKQEIVRD